jgi:hypothetical protein
VVADFLDQVQAGLAAVETLKVAQPIVSLVGDHAINNYIAAISAVIQKPSAQEVPAGV